MSKKAYLLLIGFFCINSNHSLAQDQKIADSLKIIYEEKKLNIETRLEVLRNLSFNETNNLDLSIKYAEQLIRLSTEQNNYLYLFRGYHIKGIKLRDKGHLDDAINFFFKALNASKEANYSEGVGTSYCSIADVYNINGHHKFAIDYYFKAINILRQSNDSLFLASALLNIGDEYLSTQKYDSALFFFSESNNIFKEINYTIGIAYNQGNIGMVYANLGKMGLAEESMWEAIKILEASNDYYPICFYLISISNIYLKNLDFKLAIKYATMSLDIAIKHGLKKQVSDAHQQLYHIYNKKGFSKKALYHFKAHIEHRDSVNNLESIQKIADLRTKFEVNIRDKEIAILESEKTLSHTFIIVFIILLIMSILFILYFRQKIRTAKILSSNTRKEYEQNIEKLLNAQESKALEALINGSERERKRIAQDLHNHFGSLLATIKVNISAIEDYKIPNQNTLETLINKACTDIRSISHELNMGISEDFGLVQSLKELTEHLQIARGLHVELSISIGSTQLSSPDEILIYRIVQELISNVLKHAEATKLSILLTCFEEERLINILIEDNGKGFIPKSTPSQSKGIGLNSLNKMILKKKGEMKIDSNSRRGTTISIDLPITITQVAFKQ
ncbi:ATP-binding protein [Flammeovirga pacifica]|uniref:histidine kinase n=1 Tax=Flammeovirga pacifica TaxID=915059 RepID=A0A1S1YSI2_FLAPC|nr:tetratricopeptide repeat-containing sensor histidine kinase [Flammeovirga pacifica]OHX63980.1 hypothetical protein NH26_20430 [Flammeovirga pacifica]